MLRALERGLAKQSIRLGKYELVGGEGRVWARDEGRGVSIASHGILSIRDGPDGVEELSFAAPSSNLSQEVSVVAGCREVSDHPSIDADDFRVFFRHVLRKRASLLRGQRGGLS
jgi:hypothetical protein